MNHFKALEPNRSYGLVFSTLNPDTKAGIINLMHQIKIFEKAFVLVLILGIIMLMLTSLYDILQGKENIYTENLLLGIGFTTLIVTFGIYFWKKKRKAESNPNPQEPVSQTPF